MLHFRKLTITDRAWAQPFIEAENSRSADYNFGNIYMWDGAYRQHLDRASTGRLLTKLRYEDMPFFAFPIGSGDVKPGHRGADGVCRAPAAIPSPSAASPRSTAPCWRRPIPAASASPRTATASTTSIPSKSSPPSAGKKLHGKRNFCNRFEKEHSWEFKRLTPRAHALCAWSMLGEWQGELRRPARRAWTTSTAAIVRGFMRWKELGLEGGVLFADGKLVGFTVGEVISTDTFDVHFEKAFASMPGAYPMVCREFAKQILADHPNIVYLNREDDMGHENLRSAKLEYYPEFLLHEVHGEVRPRMSELRFAPLASGRRPGAPAALGARFSATGRSSRASSSASCGGPSTAAWRNPAGEIAAMGFCIPGAVARGARCSYIYAMATAERYRGLGAAREIGLGAYRRRLCLRRRPRRDAPR